MQSSIPSLPGKQKPYIMAHRGNKVKCPENTLAAFRQALADGADIIETDIHPTVDDTFVCIHDATVDRTTDGTGVVEEMRLEEIRNLKAANGRPAFENEKVPTLQEFIELIPHDVAIALELKSDKFLDRKVCKRLVAQLRQSEILSRTLILSFNKEHLETIGKIDSELHLGWITLTNPIPVNSFQILGPFWPLLLLNPFYMRTARARNQAVCPLDPNPDSRLRLYLRLRCDAVMTDDPGSTRLALNKLLT